MVSCWHLTDEIVGEAMWPMLEMMAKKTESPMVRQQTSKTVRPPYLFPITMLSWGSAPWHYAILVILTAHFLALLAPAIWASLISAPIRLYVLEVTGLALALVATFALGLLVFRLLMTPRLLTSRPSGRRTSEARLQLLGPPPIEAGRQHRLLGRRCRCGLLGAAFS